MTQAKRFREPGREEKSRDHFLELMLSGMGHPNVTASTPMPVTAAPYTPMHQLRMTQPAPYRLPAPAQSAQLRPESPAIDVMTDLSKITPITTRGLTSLGEAEQIMRNRGVRALFVVSGERQVLGIITAADILGERPVQFAQQRGITHDEVVVRDIMTPAERLEAIDLYDVLHARVGDVIATLRLAGRQHALVVDRSADPSRPTVRGIFSLTQIARQLGVPPQPMHDLGRTFVELMAALEGGR
jgi:hypothetical protein